MFRSLRPAALGVPALAAFLPPAVAQSSLPDIVVTAPAIPRDRVGPVDGRLFFSERLECYHCHGGLLFSDNIMHSRLIAPEVGFHDTGVAATGGIGEHTGDPRQMGAFRTPSLRNNALTAPYMHDGSMATLHDVIRHYERGGRQRGPHTSSLLAGFRLSPQDRRDLIAFLESLTDSNITTDSRFSDPFTVGQSGR
jgi:cytochrome c peroxidase